jgi:hypothetical protein
LLHEPQWLASFCRSMQRLPPQVCIPRGHWHWPFWHVLPMPQLCPHVPQSVMLFCRSTQWPLQTEPPGQAQLPLTQAGAAGS